jgi:hypothetical protein
MNKVTGDIPGSQSKNAGRSRPDLVTLAGWFVALAGIFGGLLMEGARIKDVAQLTAALIVLGGSAGAVMVSTPFGTLKNCVGRLKDVIFDSAPDLNGVIDEVIGFATQARKQGLVSLEPAANRVEDPFLRKALTSPWTAPISRKSAAFCNWRSTLKSGVPKPAPRCSKARPVTRPLSESSAPCWV